MWQQKPKLAQISVSVATLCCFGFCCETETENEVSRMTGISRSTVQRIDSDLDLKVMIKKLKVKMY